MVWEKLRKQMGVVTGCFPKDKTHIVVDHSSDIRAVETESIFKHHAFQIWMILALVILLDTSILHDDHFRAQGKYCPLVGMDNGCAEHLLIIFDFSISVNLFYAVGRTDLC
jgi:hypothetical protein